MSTGIVIGLSVVFVSISWMLYEIKNAPLIIDLPEIELSKLILESRYLENKILFQQSVMSDAEYSQIVSRFWQIQNLISDLVPSDEF